MGQSLKANIRKAQLGMKVQANNNRRDVGYNIGNFVYVKLQSYHQHYLRLTKNQKLFMHYFGPFSIVARIVQVTYKLQFMKLRHGSLSPLPRVRHAADTDTRQKCVRHRVGHSVLSQTRPNNLTCEKDTLVERRSGRAPGWRSGKTGGRKERRS